MKKGPEGDWEAQSKARWHALRDALGSIFTDRSTDEGRLASELAHQAAWYALQSLNPNLSARNRERLSRRCSRATQELMGFGSEKELRRFIYEQVEHFAWHKEREGWSKLFPASKEPFAEPNATSRARNVLRAVADADPALAAQLDIEKVAFALTVFSWKSVRGKGPPATRQKAINAILASTRLGTASLKQIRKTGR